MRILSQQPWIARLAVLSALAAFVWLLSTWGFALLGGFPPIYDHLGAEYYNIARSIADGRGYANPFGEPTGPTAWMPPLFPLLLSGLLVLFKDKASVGVATAVLTGAAHVVIAWAIFCVARRFRKRLSPLLAVAFYLVWLCAYYYWFFEFTHDIWLVGIVATAIVWNVCEHVSDGRSSPWRWGLTGGLAALTSPTLLAAWGVLSVACFVRERRVRKPLIVAAAIAIALAAPWTVRNAVVFGRFIPVKSNLFYDAYAANVIDDDGVYDNMTIARHPYSSPTVRFEYSRMGETRFLEDCRHQFFAAARARPAAFLHKVLNRLAASTLWYPTLQREAQTSWGDVLRKLLYPLPLVGTFFALLRRDRSRPFWIAIAVLIGVYLLPYVLVAFYARYVMSVSVGLVLLAYAGADELASRLAARREAAA